MTSQSILWNLLNENLKRRILTVVLSVYFVVMSAFSAITSIQNAGSVRLKMWDRQLYFKKGRCCCRQCLLSWLHSEADWV